MCAAQEPGRGTVRRGLGGQGVRDAEDRPSPVLRAGPHLSVCFSLAHFSSVAQSCPTRCDPMDCSTPGHPVHQQLLELTQTHVHRVGDAIQPSHAVIPFSSCLQSFPASGSFPINQFFASDGQGTGVSASASVLPMNTQE